MADDMNDGTGGGGIGIRAALHALRNLVQATYKVGTIIQSVFPTTGALSTSATSGAASALPSPPAKYMTITATDGNAYKIPLYNP